jgi:hypothetical protein
VTIMYKIGPCNFVRIKSLFFFPHTVLTNTEIIQYHACFAMAVSQYVCDNGYPNTFKFCTSRNTFLLKKLILAPPPPPLMEPEGLLRYSQGYGVGTAQSVRATGWMTRVRFPAETRFFSSPQRPDRLWGGHLNSYPIVCFLAGKAVGA